MDGFMNIAQVSTFRNTVAVIGTAGRNHDSVRMNSRLWKAMIKATSDVIINKFGLSWNQVQLVSGGASFADHVAVRLHLNHPESSLRLELPCRWVYGRYEDNGVRDWKINPGGLSNYYHKIFSDKIGIDSLKDIQIAIASGAEVISSNGFFDRNNQVSKSQYMVAMTFSVDIPDDGGTAYTWSKCTSSNKIHISLLNF